jgi:hypothetical protein
MTPLKTLYDDTRGAERQRVALDSTLRNADAEPFDVMVEDLSATGFRVPAVADLMIGDMVTIGISGIGLRRAVVVRASDDKYGCQFLQPIDASAMTAAMDGVINRPITFPRGRSIDIPLPAPVTKRFSVSTRALIIVGSALVCWMMILGAFRAFG